MMGVMLLVSTFALVTFGQNTPSDVRDLVGARASSGEAQLQSRGYRFVKTDKSGDRSYSNWWKGSSRTCLTVATVNGRYDSIVSGPAFDCNQGGNSGGNNGGGYNGERSTPPSWARGTFYSSDGRISLTISNNGSISVVNDGQTYAGTYYRDKIYLNGDVSTVSRNGNGIRTYNLNSRQTTYYNRTNGGGNAGGGQMSSPPSWARGTFYSNNGQITLTISDNGQVTAITGGQSYYGRYYQNRIYLNNDTSTVARNGSGISTYNLNNRQTTYYNRNQGGNSGGGNYVDVSDLVGVRASSGESELRTRGFRNVDGFKTGSTSYTIWWRSQNRQCLQVATADGRYDSLTNLTSHPKCR